VGRRPGLKSLIDESDGTEVVAVSDVPTSLLAMLYGAFLGLFSGMLLLAMSVSWVADMGGSYAVVLMLIFVWSASAYAFSWQTGELVVVFRRACAAGAIEWLVLALWFRVEALATAADVGRALTSAPMSGLVGWVERLSGTPATVGVWVCLLGWFVCRTLASPRAAVPREA
jgi:hypothetical protein